MTWPEHLDLILALLAQAPWSWIMIVGIALSAVIIAAAVLTVAGEDTRRRDVYYEDYVRGSHTGGNHEI